MSPAAVSDPDHTKPPVPHPGCLPAHEEYRRSRVFLHGDSTSRTPSHSPLFRKTGSRLRIGHRPLCMPFDLCQDSEAERNVPRQQMSKPR